MDYEAMTRWLGKMNLDGVQLTKEQRAKLFPVLGKMKKAQERAVLERCMFWSGQCEARPIGSHLIARTWLERIAEESGHVIELAPNLKALAEGGSGIAAKEVGINTKSVFPGFCELHDAKLFACLEREEFRATKEQLIAITYRSVCREACAKHQTVGVHLPGALSEDSHPGFTGNVLSEMMRCILLLAKKQSLEDQMNGGSPALQGLVIRFAACPTILASATFHPLLTFTGRKLEPRVHMEKAEFVTLSIFPGTTGGWAVLTWEPSGAKNGPLMAKSFKTLPQSLQTMALVNLVFEVTENHAISPIWWRSLETDRQADIVRRYERNLLDNRLPPPDAVVPKGKPWVNWQPTSVDYV